MAEAHRSIKLYEFNHYIFSYSNEFAGKIFVEPEGEKEKNMITIYVRTSTGKTISMKCDKKKAREEVTTVVSWLLS